MQESPKHFFFLASLNKVLKFSLHLTTGDSRQRVTISLSVSSDPDHKFKSVSMEYSADNQEVSGPHVMLTSYINVSLCVCHHKPSPFLPQNLQSLRRHHLSAINRGVGSALKSGPVLGCPVVDVRVGLQWCQVGPGTSETMVAAAAAQCLQQVWP